MLQCLQHGRSECDRVARSHQRTGHPVVDQFGNTPDCAGHYGNTGQAGLDPRPRDPLGEAGQHHHLGGAEQGPNITDGAPHADPVAERLGGLADRCGERPFPGHLQTHVVRQPAHQFDGSQRVLLRAECAQVQQPATVG